jgi:hypothetical protein
MSFACILALLVAGCVQMTPDRMPWPDDPIGASRTAPDAPPAFQDREPLPSCGEVELDQGEAIPQRAIDCMVDAMATGAELAVLQPTIEGDPLVSYYRVGPGINGIEIFTDGTLDTFGGGWWHQQCADAQDIIAPKECREL